MPILSREIKRAVYRNIITTPSFLGRYEEYDGVITFLNKIWDLKNMSSSDHRFKNAYDDAYQHLVNNDDWTYDFLFEERLNLVDGSEDSFILFLETIVHPSVRQDRKDIQSYVSKLNPVLEPSGYKLISTGYFEELPVYKIREARTNTDVPEQIIENQIPIYVRERGFRNESGTFILLPVSWDDYGFKTSFELIYRRLDRSSVRIGKVKIMKREVQSTVDQIPELFTSLDNNFCSLGQSKQYYEILKTELGTNYYSFLLGLRDVAIFPKIHEDFENDTIYLHSLVRNDGIERLARVVRFEIEGMNQNEYFKFTYAYTPPYAENTIGFNFDFEYNLDFEHRIFAIIGKNGTGKTRFLAALAKSLSDADSKSFTPRKPIYGKVFTVSYSFFDRFEIPTSNASFNYVYCGLKRSENEWKTESDMYNDFLKAIKLIEGKGLVNEWYKILKSFISLEILTIAFEEEDELFNNEIDYIFNEIEFNKIKHMLSSGQSITLYMVTEILSQIRYASLILFDEPETHLHPNAISALLNTLFEIVNKFQSFCILATHSPLIIQEIPARNVFVLEREGDKAYVRDLERESFGENLTVITQDIFGNGEVPRHFVNIIKGLVSKEKTYSEILTILETDGLPVTSNIRLYIKALLSE